MKPSKVPKHESCFSPCDDEWIPISPKEKDSYCYYDYDHLPELTKCSSGTCEMFILFNFNITDTVGVHSLRFLLQSLPAAAFSPLTFFLSLSLTLSLCLLLRHFLDQCLSPFIYLQSNPESQCFASLHHMIHILMTNQKSMNLNSLQLQGYRVSDMFIISFSLF